MGNCFKKEEKQYFLNTQKPHYKILVIGMSGAGKTTTINMLVNQAMSMKYRQERKIAITQIVQLINADKEIVPCVLKNNIERFSPFQSDQLKEASDSQTTKCNIYEINNEDYDISFIDTPGLDDSQGSKADQRNQATIVDCILHNLGISCILYVHRSNETENRLILSKYFIFLKNILPEWIFNTCIMCFTNVVTPGRIPAIKNLKEQGVSLDRQIFLENDCLIPFDLIPFGNKKGEKEAYLTQSESFWASNKNQYDCLIGFLREMPQRIEIQFPVMNQDEKLAMKKDIYQKHKTQALMKMIYDCISNAEYLYRQRQQLQLFVKNKKKYLTKLFNKISNYNSSQTEQVNQVQEFIQRRQLMKQNAPVMFCYVCLEVCHKKCPVEKLTENRSVNILKCKVFKKEECKKCSHHPIYHSHTKFIPTNVDEPFGQNLTQKETYQSLHESIQNDQHYLEQFLINIQFDLSKAAQFQQEINQDISTQRQQYDLVKEYLCYSKQSNEKNQKQTEEQQNQRLNELNFLNNLYQEILYSNRASKLKPQQGFKEITTLDLQKEIQKEIENLLDQYQQE